MIKSVSSHTDGLELTPNFFIYCERSLTISWFLNYLICKMEMWVLALLLVVGLNELICVQCSLEHKGPPPSPSSSSSSCAVIFLYLILFWPGTTSMSPPTSLVNCFSSCKIQFLLSHFEAFSDSHLSLQLHSSMILSLCPIALCEFLSFSMFSHCIFFPGSYYPCLFIYYFY